ncbi:MAG: RNA polymerase factor sigma-54 [Candidatus Puniceispirillaceae bacterium]
MQLSQSIKLRQKQSLVMTPQLQQAIKLLQMSNIELSQHLQEQMYENPFLEVKTIDDRESEKAARNEPVSDNPATPSADGASSPSEAGQDLQASEPQNDLSALKESAALKDDPTHSSEYENRFDTAHADTTIGKRSNASGDGDFNLIENVSVEEGFYPQLFRQLNLAFAHPADRLIAGHFVAALEPTGWIGARVEEIATQAGSSIARAEAVLEVLQGFEPAGIFARDLADCLRIQLIDQELFTPEFGLLLDNLEQLGRGEVKQLARKLKCEQGDIMDMLAIIRTLNPKPGEHLGIEYRDMPSPDVIVSRTAKGWSVELNRSTLPSVLVNEEYADKMAEQQRKDKAAADYASDTLANARWLKRAVEQRNQTTLKISAEIIRHQTDFLEKGLDYLKPLSLRDVAKAVGMHESTVSRVTTGLLISTPRGGMPLKSFFSVNIATKGSDMNASAASVRNMVKKIISQEVPGKPLSDEAISKMISKQGIDLARRTVAKYREMLNIPSSSQRRMQARLTSMR